MLTCRLCLKHYDLEENCPLIAPCGHTFCKECIEHIIRTHYSKSFVCPEHEDPTDTGLTSLARFKPNLTLMAIVKQQQL